MDGSLPFQYRTKIPLLQLQNSKLIGTLTNNFPFTNRPALMKIVLVFFGIIAACGSAFSQGRIPITIQTELGTIEVHLDSARAPRSVTNFLRYVDGDFYSGGLFHRTVTVTNQPTDSVRIEVIQAGIDPEREKAA